MQRSVKAAAPGLAGLRRVTPPASLAALLAIVISVGIAWALLVSPWQSPDELAHFSYAQSLAENFAIPSTSGRPEASSDLSFADGAVGASRGAFWPASAPPDWSAGDYRAYLSAEHSAQRPSTSDGTGPSSATGNPPLYYLLAAGAYLIDSGGTAFGRLYAIRLFGVLLLSITAIAAWLLAGEVFGRRRLPQLACAAVASLMPMSTFIGTAVNPDAMLMPLWTLAFWLGARVIKRRAQGSDAVFLCAVTAAAILTKATSYALAGPVGLALLIGLLRRPAPERLRALIPLAGAALVLVVPVIAWLDIASTLGGVSVTAVASSPAHPFLIRQFLSYVWQFYLPRLPFETPFRITSDLPAYDLWLRQGTGVFGWLDVYLPGWLYQAAAVTAAGLAVLTVGLLSRLRRPVDLLLLAFFGLTLLALLVLLHVVEYRTLIIGGGPFLQGRYLLPVVSLLGLAVGLVVARIPFGFRPAACALVLTTLLAVQVISLSTVAHAYYL
jgi:4-amino-4-deoxy-L-arabinose transferase-like glycosyltransferase